MSISGANMERVVRARDHHNSTCPLGPAIEVHLNPADVERCGWDEGDEIGGLLVISSSEQTAGTLKVAVTMARSRSTSRLNRLDLPTLGRPMMASVSPSCTILP